MEQYSEIPDTLIPLIGNARGLVEHFEKHYFYTSTDHLLAFDDAWFMNGRVR